MAFLEKFQPSDHHFKQNSSKKYKSVWSPSLPYQGTEIFITELYEDIVRKGRMILVSATKFSSDISQLAPVVYMNLMDSHKS